MKPFAMHPDAVRCVLLIRHAQAEDRMSWIGSDQDRPLTEKGHRQAVAIAQWLSLANISHVLSSPAVRCVQTVRPLCEFKRIDLAVDERLMEGSPIALPTMTGLNIVCAHGDNIPHLLARLGVHWEQCQKGSIWQLDIDATGQLLQTLYTPNKAIRTSQKKLS